MRRRRRPRPAASAGGGAVSDINITPMVDVLLCLLIFTMVIQPGLLKGVDVQVPPPEPVGAAASAAENRDQIILRVASGPAYTLNHEAVAADAAGGEDRGGVPRSAGARCSSWRVPRTRPTRTSWPRSTWRAVRGFG